jgi:hypothetical protein
MQALRAAGLPVIGDAFPANWGDTIREANPRGFYESKLTAGVYYRTNPNPVTGDYLSPQASQGYAVKIFAAGLVRSDIAFLDRVIVTCRPWQEYTASILKLRAMSADAKDLDLTRRGPDPLHPALEWWIDQFQWVRDVASRRYPVNAVSYASLLADPEGTFARALSWIGHGDAKAAAAVVEPALHRNDRRQTTVAPPDVPPGTLDVFEDLYLHVHEGKPLSEPFVLRLNEVYEQLAPHYAAHRATYRRTAAANILAQPPIDFPGAT